MQSSFNWPLYHHYKAICLKHILSHVSLILHRNNLKDIWRCYIYNRVFLLDEQCTVCLTLCKIVSKWFRGPLRLSNSLFFFFWQRFSLFSLSLLSHRQNVRAVSSFLTLSFLRRLGLTENCRKFGAFKKHLTHYQKQTNKKLLNHSFWAQF